MGYARWSPTDWARYSKSVSGKSTERVFTARGLAPDLDPRGITLRESRDSDKNPNSNAIIVGLDVTGSMGMIADALARRGLGVLVEEVLDRQPVSDPHVMVMGIGDVVHDRAPLQVTQFEADIRIAKQLERLWLEKGGGGNRCESYTLPWYFAAMHTAIDCFEKRGRKGYLFTVGDEEPPDALLAREIGRVMGNGPQGDLDSRQLLAMASRMYHVFHVVVEEGHYASQYPDRVLDRWQALLGQNVLRLSDHTKLAEVIVSAIEVNEGRDKVAVAGSWRGETAKVVERAVNALVVPDENSGMDLVRF